MGGGGGAFARKNVGWPRKYVTSLHSVYRILGYFCSNERFDCLNCLNLMFCFPGLLEHGLLEISDADLCEVKKVSTLQIIGVNGVNAVSGKPSKKLKGKASKASKASKAGSSDPLFGRSAHRSLNKWIQMGGLRGPFMAAIAPGLRADVVFSWGRFVLRHGNRHKAHPSDLHRNGEQKRFLFSISICCVLHLMWEDVSILCTNVFSSVCNTEGDTAGSCERLKQGLNWKTSKEYAL